MFSTAAAIIAVVSISALVIWLVDNILAVKSATTVGSVKILTDNNIIFLMITGTAAILSVLALIPVL